MEEQNLENIKTIEAYKYPLWIKFFVLGVVAIIIYSLFFLPRYLQAAKNMHKAELMYKAGNYDEAINFYGDAYSIAPTSKSIRIGAAEAIFSNKDKSDDEFGLSLLQGINLDESDWKRISKVMPVDYQQYFETKKY